MEGGGAYRGDKGLTDSFTKNEYPPAPLIFHLAQIAAPQRFRTDGKAGKPALFGHFATSPRYLLEREERKLLTYRITTLFTQGPSTSFT